MGITHFLSREPEPQPLPSVSLPLLHSWAKQAKGCGSCGGAVLLELLGGPVRAQGRSQTCREWGRASQLFEPRKELCPGGSPPCPCLANLSPAPLDICQHGCPVFTGIMCPETGWAQLAQCQASQESSNRTLSPTLVCPECPDVLDLPAPAVLCASPCPWLQRAGNPHPP